MAPLGVQPILRTAGVSSASVHCFHPTAGVHSFYEDHDVQRLGGVETVQDGDLLGPRGRESGDGHEGVPVLVRVADSGDGAGVLIGDLQAVPCDVEEPDKVDGEDLLGAVLRGVLETRVSRPLCSANR